MKGNFSTLAIVASILGCLSCNFSDRGEGQEEAIEELAQDSVIVATDSALAIPEVPPINYAEITSRLIKELTNLEQQLSDSLDRTAAPAEVQEELMLRYKQLSQKAKRHRLNLQELQNSSDSVSVAAAEPIAEAEEITEEIRLFLVETDSLY